MWLLPPFFLSAAPAWGEGGFDPKYERDYNILNPLNQFDPGNPANPLNQFNSNNPLNRSNQYNPKNPLNRER